MSHRVHPYRDYATFLSEHFDCKVQKIALDAGFTCPNRDGTRGRGGCIYCSTQAFNPRYCNPSLSITSQLEAGKRFWAHKYPSMKYLAYFQAHTNTYAPVPQLMALYREALACNDVVGIVIATRPDCLSDELLIELQELSRSTFVMIELGIETVHDHTLQLINRCHDWATSRNAIERIAQRGIPCGVHLILGLPGESLSHMCASVDAIGHLPIATVKFHQLQVVKGTRLARMALQGIIQPPAWTARQYAHVCAQLVNRLAPHIAIERLVSESPGHMLLSPRWGLKPQEITAMVDSFLQPKVP